MITCICMYIHIAFVQYNKTNILIAIFMYILYIPVTTNVFDYVCMDTYMDVHILISTGNQNCTLNMRIWYDRQNQHKLYHTWLLLIVIMYIRNYHAYIICRLSNRWWLTGNENEKAIQLIFYAHKYTHTYTRTHTCSMYIQLYVHYMYIHIYTHKILTYTYNTCVYRCTYIHTYANIGMCVCTYVYYAYDYIQCMYTCMYTDLIYTLQYMTAISMRLVCSWSLNTQYVFAIILCI